MGAGVELICLAGFMRILSAAFVERWRGRILNIHPSLLPDLRGLHTHERALAEARAEHGCTVHFVTADLDAGPIVAQARVPVLPGDDAGEARGPGAHRGAPHLSAGARRGRPRRAHGRPRDRVSRLGAAHDFRHNRRGLKAGD